MNSPSVTERDKALAAAIHTLDRKFRGVFGPETIAECVNDCGTTREFVGRSWAF
jgi:hypothetical protein